MALTQSQQLLYELIRLNGGVEDKTKLAKLQYFADFIHYAFKDRPISQPEIVYIRQKQGPLSRDLSTDIKALKDERLISENPPYHYAVTEETETSLPSDALETIRYVVNKYGKNSWLELMDISHAQEPYLSANHNGVIEFFTAYNLVDYYPDYGTVA